MDARGTRRVAGEPTEGAGEAEAEAKEDARPLPVESEGAVKEGATTAGEEGLGLTTGRGDSSTTSCLMARKGE